MSTDTLRTAAIDEGGLTMEVERTRSAWRAHMKQELVAPVTTVIGLADMLHKDARERGPRDFVADLDRVRGAGQRLLGQVNELLDLSATRVQEIDFGKKARHDLRTPLTQILGYCELWLDDAADLLLEGFVPDLRQIHALGQRMLGGIDELVRFSQQAGELAQHDSAMPAMIHQLVKSVPALPPAGGQTETGALLVVEDNEDNRNLLCRWLHREGHAAACAADGRRALEMIRAQPFDLVLLDIIMPELNGLQVLQQLKADERLRHVPVIMISAFNDMDSVVRCIEMGAEDYLTKPFNPVLLKARINACLEKKRLRDREVRYLEQIQQEQRRSDELLHVILPGEVVKELKTTNTVKPRRYDNVAVMFCDIVGFTPYCDGNCPEQVVLLLQQLIETWEEIAVQHGVQKIKTIGDAFMAAAGLLQQTADDPVLHCVRCGLDMIAATQKLPCGWNLRVGIHAGPVVAGVIGRRQYLYDLWGDAVNTAARMESHGVPGAVVLSGTAWQQVARLCAGTSRGVLAVKGKGSMEMVRFDGFV